jgi:hypothetical protein
MLSIFLTQGATGSLLALLLVPARQAGRSFFRYSVAQGATLILLGLLAGWNAPAPPGRTLLFGAAAALLMAAAGLIHLDRAIAGRALLIGASILCVVAVVRDERWLANDLTLGAIPLRMDALYALDSLTAGLTLGGALSAMVLGHYYLNIPGLSVSHLERLCLALLGAVVARAAVVAACLAVHWPMVRPMIDLLSGREAAMDPSGTDPFLLIFVIIQILFGILGAAATAVGAWRTAAIGSTQSATGILYVALLMVIMGELASRYLLVVTRLPL